MPINLGDVRVRAFGERLVPGGTVGLPAGQNYYQVNIEVTSLVTRVLDAAQFTSSLIDGAGAQYSFRPRASQAAGGLGWAKGALSPGQTLTATAGFQVPAGMPGPRLEWNFATEPDNPYVARVSLPYQQIAVAPTLPPTVAPVAEVALLNVNISPEGNELRIVGTVRNLTDKFLTVSLRDFSLEERQPDRPQQQLAGAALEHHARRDAGFPVDLRPPARPASRPCSPCSGRASRSADSRRKC